MAEWKIGPVATIRAGLAAAIFLVFAFSTAHATPPIGFDRYVERSLSTFGVPGAGVAIVEADRSFARGYGIRRIGKPARVDAHTLFPIGSNTKAFTVAGLAMMVDRGKLSWDDHVEDKLPGFRLFDTYASHELTVRDLLTHRSGLGKGEGDLLIFPQTSYTRQEIVDRLRYLRPKTSFREVFAYDNVLYIVAGTLLERLSGERWEDFVRQEMFGPMGMADAVPAFGEIMTDNRGWPHARFTGIVRGLGPVAPLPVVPNIDNEGPAGSINASAADMTRWLSVQLHAGAFPGGGRLFSAERGREMWTPQVIEPAGDVAPELAATRPNMAAYALGWTVTDYRGHHIVTHGGGVYGGISAVVLIPEIGVGFVVLTNGEEHFAVDAISHHLLDHYLGFPETDWISTGKTVRDRQLAQAERTVRAALAVTGPSSPALPLATYAGVYRDPWYGTVTVDGDNRGLTIRFDKSLGMHGPLEHVDHDTFRTRWADSATEDAYVTFTVGPGRKVTSATMKPVSSIADFSFDYRDLALVPVIPGSAAPSSP